jgi:hypothetical protein
MFLDGAALGALQVHHIALDQAEAIGAIPLIAALFALISRDFDTG